MTTKRALIESALGELGLAQYVFDISPDRLQSALATFNRMAAHWDGKKIRTGWNFGDDIDAQAGIPDTLEECFVLNGALRIAPSFGKVPSADTRTNARNAFNGMVLSQRNIPEVPYPSSMPVGTGNRGGASGPQYFPSTTEVPGLNEGATEY